MGPTERLIDEFARQSHPLGTGIREEEVTPLVEALRQRLGASAKELDLSPTSLGRLEAKLIVLHAAMQAQGEPHPDEELVQVIREVAAYIGAVLVRHAEGHWVVSPTLWLSEIRIDRPVLVIKPAATRTHATRSLFMGNIAASVWDGIALGVKPELGRIYRSARAQRVRERL